MSVKEIIKGTKYNPEGELIVYLFEHCNLACQFCPQNHDSTFGMDAIRDKITNVKLALDSIQIKGKTSCKVNIMGGELFSDFVEDKYFEDYKFLIEKIREHSAEINLPVKIHISTNLVWSDRERVKKLLDEAKIPLFVSYDPAGRFNTSTLKIFYENVKYFKDYILQIGCVMTKPSMQKIMSKNAPHFDELYENFDMFFDTFSMITGLDGEFLSPKDVELREFYKFMWDNYPKAEPFAELSYTGQNHMSCMQTMNVMTDNSITTCGAHEIGVTPYIDNKGVQTREVMSPMEDLVETKWFDDYNCLMCPHMQRCSFSCFLNNHMSKMRTQEECWLKEVYDYVDQKS